MAVKLTTKSGQTVLVDEHRVSTWEARGYQRADQAAPDEKAPAKKAPAKRASSKSKN